MASLIQWTCVWASSGRCWRTGNPGVLQSMGLQSWTQLRFWTTTKFVLPLTLSLWALLLEVVTWLCFSHVPLLTCEKLNFLHNLSHFWDSWHLMTCDACFRQPWPRRQSSLTTWQWENFHRTVSTHVWKYYTNSQGHWSTWETGCFLPYQ